MKKFAASLFLASALWLPAAAGVREDSLMWIGAAYANDPLGEGAGYDPDPLIRFDAFDCQTFVETALAGGDEAKLTRIRYDGGAAKWEGRHHFWNDWVRGNRAVASDITQALALMAFGRPAREREVIIDRAAWARKTHPKSGAVMRGREAVRQPYIPLADILAAKERFAGAVALPMVVAFVINDPRLEAKIGTELAVAHVGLLLPEEGGGLTLRHASSARGRVADEDFFDYIARLGRHKKYLGVQFLSIRTGGRQ